MPGARFQIENDSKRTITMTFRIKKNIMETLRRDAKNRGISLNMYVNQIFKNFTDWYAFEQKVGMIPLSKPVVLDIFRNLKKEEVLDIATRIGKNEIYDIALFMRSKVDMDSFLEWIESRMKNSSMNVSHSIRGNTHIYAMKHDVCLNWSLYHKTILELIFNEIIGKEVHINITETTFTIEFEK